MASVGSYGTEDGQLKYPYVIAIDENDILYVIDAFNYSIKKFTSDIKFISKWGSQESPDSLPAIFTTLNIPAVTGSLTIDDKLDDAFWQSARTQLLTNREDAGNPSLPVWLSKQWLKK